MLNLNIKGLSEAEKWEQAGVKIPCYDMEKLAERTMRSPRWVHFGAGNIFRGYIAAIADNLLEKNEIDTGIIAVETFDTDIIEKIFKPFDNLALSVKLFAGGSSEKQVIGGVAQSFTAQGNDFEELKAIFKKDTLQMVSFTITEKGYGGEIMRILSELLYERFKAGGAALALVSMDNFQENGERLKSAVLEAAGGLGEDFRRYINEKVSFPWSMIDKITPRPSGEIGAELTSKGIGGMEAIVTSKNTYIAPFVNSEAAEYLVIEDNFPNGRPPLEKAGVYMTDRETVSLTERMKVTACLNPLHTALAVFGCLLGYTSIWEEMKNKDLLALVKKIGYDEGLKTVVSPKIIDPEKFIDEVINERLPNPFIPDTPQRIATDTSQKIPVRFCNTIRAYQKEGNAEKLVAIPLAIAAWLRYLQGSDDSHTPFTISPDPMLSKLQGMKPEDILLEKAIFDTDLSNGGLDAKILGFYERMTEKGGVAGTLAEELK
ncbi:MAG: mannitol dehydrogenase family protein [Oscillospiraceae bacterium]|nr:mannitol dehydrogenase family protein [Oscillospiraceae bacterium]